MINLNIKALHILTKLFLKDGAFQKETLLKNHGYAADYFEPIYTCKDCKDRVLGCHSNCIKYKEFQENVQNITRKHLPITLWAAVLL